MALAPWPASLPQTPGYRHEGQQAGGLLDVETLLSTQRTRTYPEEAATFTFRQITAAQFQAFRAWWDVTLNQVAPFSAPWLAKAGYDHHFCRFDAEQPWEAVMNGRRFDLTVRVEVVSGVPMDNGNVAYWLPGGQ